MNDDVFEKGVI